MYCRKFKGQGLYFKNLWKHQLKKVNFCGLFNFRMNILNKYNVKQS